MIIGVWALTELEFQGNNHPLGNGYFRLASGCVRGIIKIFDIDFTNRQVIYNDRLLNVGSWVRSMIQLRDGRLVSGGHEGKIKVWDVRDNVLDAEDIEYLFKIENTSHQSNIVTKSAVLSLIELRDGRVASGDHNGHVKIWDLKLQGLEVEENRAIFAHMPPLIVLKAGSAVKSMTQLRDGRLVAGCFNSDIHFFNLTNRSKRTIKNTGGSVDAIAQTGENEILRGHFKGSVKKWSTTQIHTRAQPISKIKVDGVVGGIKKLRDGRIAIADFESGLTISPYAMFAPPHQPGNNAQEQDVVAALAPHH